MSQRGYPDCRDSRESRFREHRGRVARLEFIGSDKSVISALGDIGRRETITERLTRCDDCFMVRHTHTLKPLPPA